MFFLTSSNCRFDYGITWEMTSAPGYQNWYGVATSDSGQIVYAAVQLGDIYKSLDYGVTWAPLGAEHSNWHSIATTYDGQSIIVAASGGSIRTAQSNSNSGICDIIILSTKMSAKSNDYFALGASSSPPSELPLILGLTLGLGLGVSVISLTTYYLNDRSQKYQINARVGISG